MKRLITLIALVSLFQIQTRAQGAFEGIIRWNISMNITDPAMKAKMDEAQKKMNDPATQAQMAELKKKMEDPQFKKMMESNPQMKAQMEQMMKMSGGGGEMVPFKEMVLKVKGDNSLVKMSGGMIGTMEILNTPGKPSVRIDHENKTYTTLSDSPAAAQQAANAKVTKTGETAKIAGYNCTKYLVEVTDGRGAGTHTVWATTDIKGIDMKRMARQQQGEQIFNYQIDGALMKMEMNSPQGTMVMEVTDVKKESLSASDFVVPSDYKESKM